MIDYFSMKYIFELDERVDSRRLDIRSQLIDVIRNDRMLYLVIKIR